MRKNMGSLDRTLRVALALLVLALFLFGTISGTVALVLGIIAVIFVVTSFLGACPAYLPFGLSTRKHHAPR
jgi:hypothetical protein